jgi:hypothetical protein
MASNYAPLASSFTTQSTTTQSTDSAASESDQEIETVRNQAASFKTLLDEAGNRKLTLIAFLLQL